MAAAASLFVPNFISSNNLVAILFAAFTGGRRGGRPRAGDAVRQSIRAVAGGDFARILFAFATAYGVAAAALTALAMRRGGRARAGRRRRAVRQQFDHRLDRRGLADWPYQKASSAGPSLEHQVRLLRQLECIVMNDTLAVDILPRGERFLWFHVQQYDDQAAP